MKKVRFQADADFKQSIVNRVLRRQPNVDFQSAKIAELEGKKDREVLKLAAQEGRVLVTHDRRTMPTEFGEFVRAQNSSGVLIVSQKLSINESIEALILIWEATTAEEWINQIMSIPF